MTGVSWTPTAPARGPDPRGPGRDGRRGRPALIFSIPILVTIKVTEERWKLTLSAADARVSRARRSRIFIVMQAGGFSAAREYWPPLTGGRICNLGLEGLTLVRGFIWATTGGTARIEAV